MIFYQNDNVEVVKIEAGDIKTEPIDPVTGKQRLLKQRKLSQSSTSLKLVCIVTAFSLPRIMRMDFSFYVREQLHRMKPKSSVNPNRNHKSILRDAFEGKILLLC